MRAIFVTANEHKRREVQEILGVELKSVDLDLPEIQAIEPAEVAAEKVRAARQALGAPDLPVLVEDSGLMVDAWDGFPGALTKWLMRSVGNDGLLRILSPGEDRSARAVCVVALAEPDGTVRTFRGEVPGTLAPEPRGTRRAESRSRRGRNGRRPQAVGEDPRPTRRSRTRYQQGG